MLLPSLDVALSVRAIDTIIHLQLCFTLCIQIIHIKTFSFLHLNDSPSVHFLSDSADLKIKKLGLKRSKPSSIFTYPSEVSTLCDLTSLRCDHFHFLAAFAVQRTYPVFSSLLIIPISSVCVAVSRGY